MKEKLEQFRCDEYYDLEGIKETFEHRKLNRYAWLVVDATGSVVDFAVLWSNPLLDYPGFELYCYGSQLRGTPMSFEFIPDNPGFKIWAPIKETADALKEFFDVRITGKGEQ